MNNTLENNLNIIPRIISNIRDYILYFIDSRNGYGYTPTSKSDAVERPKKTVDKKHNLYLSNIMVLKINDEYMITMLGLKQDNCDKRILLSSGELESKKIEECLNYNIELERICVIRYMTPDCVEIYNKCLENGNYEACINMLQELELQINEVYQNENQLKLSLKKGE